jgi:hypothetical protein
MVAVVALAAGCAPSESLSPVHEDMAHGPGATQANAFSNTAAANNRLPGSSGRVSSTATYAASKSSAELVSGLRKLREMPADSVAKWRRSLDELAKVSRRGRQAVAYRRLILDAVTSGSDQAMHARLAELPVTVSEVSGSKDGVNGTYRSYAIGGQTHVRLFIATNESTRSRPDDSGSITGGPSEATAATPLSDWAFRDDCTTYYGGSTYIGECATQQDIDDAAASLSALQSEIDGDRAEAQYLCEVHPEESCGYYASEDDAGAATLDDAPAAAISFSLEDGSESLPALPTIRYVYARVACTPSSELGVTNAFAHDGSERTGCTQQAIDAGIAGVAWIVSKVGAWDVMVNGGSKTGIGVAVAGAFLSGYALGSAMSSYISCKYAQ